MIDLSKPIVIRRTITYEDPTFYERIKDLPTYTVKWTPPNITAMTWPG